MLLWTQLCARLAATAISTEDVSNKVRCLLRELREKAGPVSAPAGPAPGIGDRGQGTGSACLVDTVGASTTPAAPDSAPLRRGLGVKNSAHAFPHRVAWT